MPNDRDISEFESQDDVVENTAPRPKTPKEKAEERARLEAERLEEIKRKKEEQKHKKELEDRKNRRKLITPAVMLVICLVASVTMLLMRFENDRMLRWLLVVAIISAIIGRLIQYMFDKFASQNETAVSDEGEVINKGAVTNEEVNGEAHG